MHTLGVGIRIDGIDLTIPRGQIYGLLGPNGAGKSTTINILAGLVNKTSGSARIWGFDIDANPRNAKNSIGIVPQEIVFDPFFTPLETLENQAGYYGIRRREALERTERYLQQLGLWERRWEPSRILSGGMKRRLMIARALIHEPKLLILDEPTAGVDIELRRSMWDFLCGINQRGTTIILTTHYLEEAESLCRNVAIIDHGRIVQNTSVKALIKQLSVETFVLDTRDELVAVPQVKGYRIARTDSHSLEVEVASDQSINPLFAALGELSIEVLSMRNKSNRLEQLFLDLVDDKNSHRRKGAAE